MLDIKSDFPSLFDKNIAFLDTAASAQKPKIVVDAMSDVMTDHYANIHRGMYKYSQVTTEKFEAVRQIVKSFINAPSTNEVIFTRNTTEAINLVAHSYGRAFLQKNDVVILSEMEHHANIVPWQLLREQLGIIIKVIPITKEGQLDYKAFKELLCKNTKFISIVHTSNALGVINDIKTITKTAKDFNADIKILVDGSQSVVHGRTDVQALNCDFFVFTGHKLYGPTGVGILWGREEILNRMPPYQGGGDMIESVTFEKTTYKNSPSRFEAGTPSIVDIIGLGFAINYLQSLDMQLIINHEQTLLTDARHALKDYIIYGDVENKAPIISFNVEGVHHSDIGTILNQCGVAVRTGHHCCMPLMHKLGINGTVRVSFGIYNDANDIDMLLSGLNKARKLLL